MGSGRPHLKNNGIQPEPVERNRRGLFPAVVYGRTTTELAADLDDMARKEGRSRSNMLHMILKRYFDALKIKRKREEIPG